MACLFFEGQNRIVYQTYRLLEKIACKFRDYIFTQNKRDIPECAKLMGNKSRALFEGNGVDVEYVNKSAKTQLPQAHKDYPCCKLLPKMAQNEVKREKPRTAEEPWENSAKLEQKWGF